MYQPSAQPARAVTRRPMPISLAIFHWTMIVITAGMWTPVYLASRRKRRTTTVYR